MKVIKRDSRMQEFDINKIKTTISRASDDIKQPLTDSDVENVAQNIKKEIFDSNKESISYKEIQKIVTIKLEETGFKNIAESYSKGRNL